MPVYLVTVHAFGSWSEANPRGYVQRDEGLQPPSERLARWRQSHARHPPVRFDRQQQELLLQVVRDTADQKMLRLHATSVTRTHLHALVSFRSPACICGAADHCRSTCPARQHVKRFCNALKRIAGKRLAEQVGPGRAGARRWLSRGEDLTPCRSREHFTHLVEQYLPRHESREGGICQRCDP